MSWAAEEMAGADLGDKRLNQRLVRLVDRLGAKPVASIPGACGGWAETQAAYRFLANDKVTWDKVMEPHWACTQERMRGQAVVLCIQDSTELDFSTQRQIQGLGPLSYAAQHGMYLHPTLAVTPQRLCLGVLDAWMWTRDAATYGQNKRHWPIEAKESMRWLEGYQRIAELAAELGGTRLVYLADRECDIYDFLVQAQGGRAAWLIRATHNRVLAAGGKLWDQVAQAAVLGEIEWLLPAAPGRPARTVRQTLRAQRVRLKPRGKGVAVTVSAVLAREESPPAGVKPVEWRLLTDLPVETLEQAAEKVDWYASRFQVEVFFRIVKTGCQVEALQLSCLERLEPALALYLIVAWRVLYLTTLGRACPELPCDCVFDREEWQAVYLVAKRQPPPPAPPPLNEMIRLMSSLGGYLGRKGDGPPGPKPIWIGLQRVRDFVLAMQAMRELQERSCV